MIAHNQQFQLMQLSGIRQFVDEGWKASKNVPTLNQSQWIQTFSMHLTFKLSNFQTPEIQMNKVIRHRSIAETPQWTTHQRLTKLKKYISHIGENSAFRFQTALEPLAV